MNTPVKQYTEIRLGEGVRAFRLGNLARDGRQIRVEFAGGAHTAEVTAREAKFLLDTSPARPLIAPSHAVTEMLGRMCISGAMTLLPLDVELHHFANITPVPHGILDVLSVAPAGYQVATSTGTVFQLSETGMRLHRTAYNGLSLPEMAAAVQRDYLYEPGTRDTVQQVLEAQGITLDELLALELVEYCGATLLSGANHFEVA